MNKTEKEFVKNECGKCKNTNAADCHIVRRINGEYDCSNKIEKSNLEIFAENELNIILSKCEDEEAIEMQRHINNDIMQMVQVFADQGHSGFSANYAINLLQKLLRYEPITPLTGADEEWTKLDYNDDTTYQNKRCPRIFKNADGKAYDVEGKIFSDDGGKSWYTCKDSRVYIEFPYVPKTEKVIVEKNIAEDEH